MPAFFRRPAFWLGLLGAAFFLVVFVSGIWEEEGPAALIYLMPAYLAVAALTAFRDRNMWLVAAVIAALVAVVEAGFTFLFALGAPPQERILPVAAIHAAGALIAAAAAVSDFLAARQGSRPIPTS